MMKSTFLSLVLVFSSQSLIGAEPPTHPEPGVDFGLTGGLSPAEFFGERQKNTACREELQETFESWKQTKAQLKQLQTDGASNFDVGVKATHTDKCRREYLAKVRECGDCATNSIDKIRVGSGFQTQTWYITDGSCYISAATQSERDAIYQTQINSLKDVNSYIRKKGGFSNVNTYFLVNPKTGRKLPDLKITTPKFHSFISVAGPVILGTQMAFGYYYANEVKESVANGVKSFLHQFTGQEPPRGFRVPRIHAKTATGKNQPIRHIRIKRVIGQWYLSNEGYIRYFTAADFGINVNFGDGIAQRILTETLVEMSLRGSSMEEK